MKYIFVCGLWTLGTVLKGLLSPCAVPESLLTLPQVHWWDPGPVMSIILDRPLCAASVAPLGQPASNQMACVAPPACALSSRPGDASCGQSLQPWLDVHTAGKMAAAKTNQKTKGASWLAKCHVKQQSGTQ